MGEKMTQAELTKAMNQARRDYDASKLVNIEVIFIAALLGFALHSWIAFIAVALGLLAALRVPYLGGALSVVLSLTWGVAGWQIASSFHAGIVPHVLLAVVAFLMAFGAHKGHRSFWA
ncbi:hypothetical protein [Paraburkholderia sp. A3RO-2L]|uniref:hypothetical protein n=1 Tax=Paraburkholderia sp. A3RO-2L TaxID=3028376 RepID=UPI003DA93E2D